MQPLLDEPQGHLLARAGGVDQPVAAASAALLLLTAATRLAAAALVGRGDAEELLGDLVDLLRPRGDVARPELRLEVNLADRVRGRRDHEVEQPQHRLRRPDVGLCDVAEDLDELVALVDQLRDADLRLDLAEEVLLARRADEVVVVVAVADVVERVLAADLLVAGLDVDVRVVLCLVVVGAIDVGEDTAERVDRALEPAEVDRDHVVDREPRDLLDRLEGQLRAPVGVGLVDLGRAVPGDVDLEVTRDREQRGGALRGIEPDEHQRVGARRSPLVVDRFVIPLVGPDQEEGLRLAGVGLRQVAVQVELRVVLEGVHDLVDLVERRDGGGRDRRRDDQQRAEQVPLPDARPRLKQLGDAPSGRPWAANSRIRPAPCGSARATRSKPTPRARDGRPRSARIRPRGRPRRGS